MTAKAKFLNKILTFDTYKTSMIHFQRYAKIYLTVKRIRRSFGLSFDTDKAQFTFIITSKSFLL